MESPVRVDRIKLLVGYERKLLPVNLALTPDKAGDALCLRDLCVELERQTGVPIERQAFVMEGQVSQALRQEEKMRKLDTPLHLVGIRNNVKIHMYGEGLETWNDEGWLRLQELNQKYEKLKVSMNKTLHNINLLQHEDVNRPSGQRDRQMNDQGTELINQINEMDNLKSNMSKVRVITQNSCRAQQLKDEVFRSMKRRTEQAEAILYALRQNNMSNNIKLQVLQSL